jgi:hypothetical protein
VVGDGGANSILQFQLEREDDEMKRCREIRLMGEELESGGIVKKNR